MGTKTVDETGAATKADEDKADVTEVTGAKEAPRATDGEAVEATGSTEATEATGSADEPTENAEATEGAEPAAEAEPEGPSGVGQGAGAVVSAALGLVSLTGSWLGNIAQAKKSLEAQMSTSSSSDVGVLLEKGYAEPWQATAMWGGFFALAALIVGVVVLARPAFGAPGRPQAPWIKSVAWAGVALGVIGLLLAVLKYTGVLLDVPAAG
ncbi:hypothetical protein [Streptomyces sp. CRN 30]|uniref:hypothetical protein n=1 Tax=Streptomyces sp. CRN 30 TaxID=3075613 RepID=UPI002A80D423|nr:hypothetical protein [Streptomyces sp. CRN 30]